MAFSIANRAMLGLFPDGDSPLVLMNKVFLNNVEKTVGGTEFQVEFQNASTNLEKVQLFNKYFEFCELTDTDAQTYSKSTSTSTELRDRSNGYYRQKHFQRALRGYNLAILFAPNRSPELSLGLANRSAVFLELSLFQECLRDIDLALANGYPEDLRVKLEERRLKCQLKAKQQEQTDIQSKFIQREEARQFRDTKLFKLKNSNPKMPSAEDCISISVDKDRGRELVVTRDVGPGTVLVVETPFVKILKNELTFDVDHCHHCLKRNFGGIPCPGCVFAIYCTELCREQAWKQYHEYECPCMTLLHLNNTPRYVQLAFRIICILGPLKSYEFFKSFRNYSKISEAAFSVFQNDTEIYDSASYLPIYNLVSNSSQHTELDNFSNTMQSLVLTYSLEKRSQFFTEIIKSNGCGEDEMKEFRSWLAALILHHLQNVPCNSISLDELKESNSTCSRFADEASRLTPAELAEKMRLVQFDQYASATYAVVSLINHSCSPNVTRVNDSVNGKMAVVTLKPLRAGEALTTSYTKVFLNDPLEERREYLRSTYYFNCQCQPCIENWPLLTQLSTLDPKFICAQCSQKYPGQTFLLDRKGKGHCSKCKKTIANASKLLAEYEKFVEQFYQSYQLVLENKPTESIENLLPCLEYFHSKLASPFSKTYMAQDVLKRALDIIVYFSD